MAAFDKIRSRISITADMWTSSNQKRAFMEVTCLYIDESWILQSHIVRFIYVPCPHTGEVLCETLHGCLVDWNLDSKLFAVTADNCSTNDSMMEDMLGKLDCAKLLLGVRMFI